MIITGFRGLHPRKAHSGPDVGGATQACRGEEKEDGGHEFLECNVVGPRLPIMLDIVGPSTVFGEPPFLALTTGPPEK